VVLFVEVLLLGTVLLLISVELAGYLGSVLLLL
jgi:hypothetical protein